ncbi:MAG: hypothetical protein EHM72_20540, partial [Calditrichaeota bacterium]
MKNLMTFALLLLAMPLMMNCTKDGSIDQANVMQIKDVGLRRDVFVRRYKMTGDYGRQRSYTPDDLKEFIEKIMEPDYLLIQDAYDKEMDKDPQIERKIDDFKINTIADNHPIKFSAMAVAAEALSELYQQKAFTVDVELVMTNSWVMTEDVHQYLLNGGILEPPKEGQEHQFPRLVQFHDLTYGQKMIHPAVLERMATLKSGEISEPIYNSGMWTIIKLKQKRANSTLQPLSAIEKTLVDELQGLNRYQQQVQLLNELRSKYKIQIHTEYYPTMISAYIPQENQGWVDKTKIDDADLKHAFIQISEKTISLSYFIADFNLAFQKVKTPRITEIDLSRFADDYINQYLLYLDVVDNKNPLNDLVMDQLVNKEHRLLLSHYLKTEIVDKVVVTDADAQKYYNENRQRWQADFSKVTDTVRSELRNKRLQEKRVEIEKALRKRYPVRYNEELLQQIADQLT